MKIQDMFNQLKQNDEMALICYYTAGYPSLDESMKNIQTIIEAGADIVEIGIPFSDPIADGASIQFASNIAVEAGVNLTDILNSVKFLKCDIPLVFMSYLNPILAYGIPKLFGDMKDAGVTGLIIPDLPADSAGEWVEMAKENGIDLIFLVTPTSDKIRKKMIAEQSSGFVYCVSTTGTTGERDGLPEGVMTFLEDVKAVTDKPIAVGFGISKPEHITSYHKVADGAIVGSRILKAVREGEDLAGFVKGLKAATKIQ